jgi:hypothetical protein
MRKILRYSAVRLICWYLAFSLSGFLLLPAAAQAAFISPSQEALAGLDSDTLTTVREALENGILTEKLTGLGLSPDDIRARLDALTPDERQAVLDDVDQIQSGGDTLVTVLVVILLVILILKLLDKEVSVE